jgi:acyl-CoA oxidase
MVDKQSTEKAVTTEQIIASLRKFDQTSSDRLKQLLFNDDPSKVGKWHALLKDPIFFPKQDMTLDEQRDLAYKRLKKVADAKLFSIWDFERDPKNLLTAHEMLSYVDGALAIKFTVQFNLFGGTLIALHTDRHKEFMTEKVDSLKHMGCFCFTELGYGNNAVEMETTATYDEKTQEFIIHSPTTLSHKYWITNGACHSNFAIVFAQTIVKGKNEGVNSFIVPIRDDQMKPSVGVQIEDMGWKIGMNGVDNGKLAFKQVRIPRVNMLNKLNDVTPDGTCVICLMSFRNF